MSSLITLNDDTKFTITKDVPDAGEVSYVVHVDESPVVACASPQHASVIKGALKRGGSSYGRERVAREVLSKAAGTDFWDGNAIWLTKSDFATLIKARGVPDGIRAKLAARIRERDEEHAATFGGEVPEESTELAHSESVGVLKSRLLDEDE